MKSRKVLGPKKGNLHPLSLRGKTALVTGAGVGLGREIALTLAEAGAFVGIHFNRSRIEAVGVLDQVRNRQGDGLLLQADLCDEGEANALVDRFVSKAGRLDIVVNNAGAVIGRDSIEKCPLEAWEKTFAVNLTSAFLVTRRAIPHLRKTGSGRVVNIVSASMYSGGTFGAGAYAAAKGALHVLTRTIAKECGPEIRANSVCPGVIETRHHAKTPPRRLADYRKATPLRRNGEAREVAMAVLYLASDAGSFTNGAALDVNGGRVLR
jgi:3-oxoacyl-[acyl-carrier protein] reductase